MFKLNHITKDDYEYLFELLKERNDTINISHRNMPSYEEHCGFWESNPYREAYIIYDGTPKGYIYLSKTNEIGIFIENVSQGQGLGKKAMELLLVKHKGERILANINPQNQKSINFFNGFGFKHIQNTYELFS